MAREARMIAVFFMDMSIDALRAQGLPPRA
jgi:hypothetical protein